ncbi:aldo/keto reductase [Bacillus marinisedimentorum]|uniref:aldo/keto reductase n=1 Tax=Bacillus marinisedimentorum TaxID=1821260 RepID=UPI000871BAA7|nr:aldo/keto reductase [Bacillus marinisedimentorum]
MKRRQLGKTGIEVSEVGFGAWQLGNAQDWSGTTETEGIRLVHEALEQGCTFFDTAPNYGLGNSETILGKALKGKRSEAVISSKFGHHSDGSVNYDPNLIRQSVEASLSRLETDYLDSVLLHNPPFDDLSGEGGHFAELEQLKKEGKIRAYGASVDTAKEMEKLLESTGSQVIEVMFNIFHQEPKQAFKKAEEAGAGLIIKVPLDSGWLSGKYDANSEFSDIRSRWSKEQLSKRAELLPVVRELLEPGESMAQAALRFILHFKEVSTVIPGAKSLEQLIGNLSSAEKQMPEATVEKLEQLWKEELEHQPLGW